MDNKLRIIGGNWRSRQLPFDDAPGLRPTPSRVRETLFNWLQRDIEGSRCLDLYAGSGALGFEAASRGARLVLQVENNQKTAARLRSNIASLAATQVNIVAAEVLSFLDSPPSQPFDLIFLDPPFGKQLVQPTCQKLEANSWLTESAKIYIEAEEELNPEQLPGNWLRLKNKVAGDVHYALFEKE